MIIDLDTGPTLFEGIDTVLGDHSMFRYLRKEGVIQRVVRIW
jgi:hypothetical protein